MNIFGPCASPDRTMKGGNMWCSLRLPESVSQSDNQSFIALINEIIQPDAQSNEEN